MHVCLISNQIAAWGKIGGFGTATRAIGAGLAKRRVRVSAVVLRRPRQAPVEQLDGITVYGLSAGELMRSGRIYRELGADVYHSQEPTVGTVHAQRTAAGSAHVVTCRDPRDWWDHVTELRFGTLSRRLRFPATWLYEIAPWVKRSVRRADRVLSPARCLLPKIHTLYGGHVDASFVPSPVRLPLSEPVKALRPLILSVGRWDRRKRIERFFRLAESLPELSFVAVGAAHEPGRDRALRRRWRSLPNLELPGPLSPFDDRLWQLYDAAWVLVNTSAREGFPYTFVEAAGRSCAVLCELDPDGFASRFGAVAPPGELEASLLWLLARDRWRERGAAGASHVAATFSEGASIDRHLDVYHEVLAGKRELPR